MIWGLFILGLCYASYMAFQIWRFNSFQEPIIHSKTEVPLSIVIPFKNEESKLTALIQSLKNLKYQNKEIILINDSSTDQSTTVIQDSGADLILIENKHQTGKKGALQTGIEQATNEHIITWDADVVVSPKTLQAFNTQFQNGADMVLGPVSFSAKNNFIANYGLLENLSLVAFGLIDAKDQKPSMANGANLGFKKNKFIEVGSYQNNLAIAGGDDEFLMHAFKQSSAIITVITSPEAMVFTESMSNWQSFINQRIRWGKKVKKYPLESKRKYYLTQAMFFAYLAFLIGALYQQHYIVVIGTLGLKVIVDLVWFWKIKSFFTNKLDIAYAILSSIFQLLIMPLVFINVQFGKAKWKGNKI